MSAPETATSEHAATVCGAGPTVNGIDVSEYDDAVDWPTAHAAGIEFAFIRVSDGLDFPDSKFATYWPGARAGGVMRGVYQFFEPDQDPTQQANYLLTQMGTLQPGDLPPVLDLETADGLSTDEVNASVKTWIDVITAAIGRPPIVYAGLYSWPTLTGSADFTTSPLWIAQYTTAACPDIPSPWTQWMFWQHSDTGVVDGVTSSQLDLDVYGGTLDQLNGFTTGGGTPCGVIAASGGTIDDGDACFMPGGPAGYMRHVTTAGFDGTLYWTHTTTASTEDSFGEWDLDFAAAGTYHVEAYTAAAFAQSKQAAYAIVADGATKTVTIDQTAVDGWQSLGDIAFAAGGKQWITLGDDTGEATAEQLVFDAIRFTPVGQSGSGVDAGLPTDGGDGDGDAGLGSGAKDSGISGGCSATGSDGGLAALAGLALVLRGRKRRRR